MTDQKTPKDLEKLLAPVWEGNSVYEETFLPVQPKGSDKNAPLTVSLLYRADEILSVTMLNRSLTFAEGIDYVLQDDGTLLLPAESAIERMAWDEYQISDEKSPYARFTCKDGGFVHFSEGAHFHNMAYCVTYRHSDGWDGFRPVSDPEKLPRTRALLKAGKPINFCFFGDSITTGANSSGKIGAVPFTPMFPILTVQALEEKYGSEIRYVNHAVGGTVSGWGCERLPVDYKDEKPDIMFIGFGMNDASGHVKPEDFIAHIRTMTEQTLALNPDCEFLLCSTTLPNPLADQFVWDHETHEPLLAALCAEYGARAALVPMTSVHRTLLAKKHFWDMTGNNINHPNDFLARVYAQTILTVLA